MFKSASKIIKVLAMEDVSLKTRRGFIAPVFAIEQIDKYIKEQSLEI